MIKHEPHTHALIPVVEKRTRKTGRPDRRSRPEATYACSCGASLPGTSRREARLTHQRHRKAALA